jgi:hypothetical protein
MGSKSKDPGMGRVRRTPPAVVRGRIGDTTRRATLPARTHARSYIPYARERRDMLLRTALPGWGSVSISASLKLARHLMIAASPRKRKGKKCVTPTRPRPLAPLIACCHPLAVSRRLPRAASPVLLPPLPLLLARHLPPFLNHHPLPNLLCLPTTTPLLLRSS